MTRNQVEGVMYQEPLATTKIKFTFKSGQKLKLKQKFC